MTEQLVSVILPTYNRSPFLPAAFRAIASQQLTSWELVVVDDGSTDDTRDVVARLTHGWPQQVRYVHQTNQGAYGARNTGLDHATGRYVAFYDSDDVWLPHHLSTCVAALEASPDVDWIYAACEVVDFETRNVIETSTFYPDGKPRPFMQLRHEVRGAARIIADPDMIRCHVMHGLHCGLQNSVIRRRVFGRMKFQTDLRNEAEDQLFPVRAVILGSRIGYVDDVHVRYHVHGGNSSGSSTDRSIEKKRRVLEPLIAGYERLLRETPLSAAERRAVRRRIGSEAFWNLGYAGYWAGGDRRQALATFVGALRVWPWDLGQWKTYALALVRVALTSPSPSSTRDVP